MPVRYVGIVRTASEVGSYHTTNAVSDMNLLGDLRHYDVYTLIPPHLAEQWAELRNKKAEAERVLRADIDEGPICNLNAAYAEWCKAVDALATFEAANGIGGGA